MKNLLMVLAQELSSENVVLHQEVLNLDQYNTNCVRLINVLQKDISVLSTKLDLVDVFYQKKLAHCEANHADLVQKNRLLRRNNR